MLQVDISSFSYSEKKILENIQFTLAHGQQISLLGESGSGKTTLLHIIYGLLHLEKGTCSFNNKKLMGPTHNLIPGEPFMKLVSQELDLMPFSTVSENIGTHLSRQNLMKDKKRTKELLEIVGLAGFEKRMVKTLSGGQKQRVMLTKALAKEPKVLLLDEPFSNIDVLRKNDLRRNLFGYLKEKYISCICATHDSEEALAFSDNIILLRDGNVEASGDPHKIYNNKENHYVANFFGDANILPSELFSEKSPSEKIILYPHQLKITEEENGLLVKVIKSYYRGKDYLIHCKWKRQDIFFEHRFILEPGTTCKIEIAE